jgi:hypothetical protein
VPLSDEQRSEVSRQFRNFLMRRVVAARKMDFEQLQPNPFLIELLVQGLGFTTADQVARFLVSQRFERSAVTAMGKTLQNIARVVAGPQSGSGVEGADLEIHRDGVRFFFQVKSGPLTINRDIANRISARLNTARRIYERTSVAVLGICYGAAAQVNPIARNILDDHGISIYAGEEFWTFISDGDSDVMGEIQSIARSTIRERSDSVSDALDGKIHEMVPLVRARYPGLA